MKIKILSDLHTEFGFHDKFDEMFTNIDADICVMPGDLSSYKGIMDTLTKIDKMVNIPVIFVPGNHEYYGTSKSSLDEKFKKASFKNIHILNNLTFELNGIIFIGSTGWMDTVPSPTSLRSLNDFRLIEDIIPYGESWGRRGKIFFENKLQIHKDRKVVCISHNMPSHRVINDKFKGSPINQCFANHWDDLIREYKPVLWVMGHTHDSIDQSIDNTRVVCNPFGYINYEVNSDFNENLIVEV